MMWRNGFVLLRHWIATRTVPTPYYEPEWQEEREIGLRDRKREGSPLSNILAALNPLVGELRNVGTMAGTRRGHYPSTRLNK
jgi:hypothetical protein